MEITSNEKQWTVTEIELSYRSKIKASLRPSVKSSRDAYQILRNHWDQNQIEFVEQFKLLLTDRASKVLGIVDISSGGLTCTVADPRIIFAAALKARACGIVAAHNHPSGNLIPSDVDLVLTRKLKEAGKLLEITLLDHIIITSESYASLADQGYI